MNLLRVWPTRYCPQCGSPLVRSNNPRVADERLGFLVGGVELPGWIGLVCGLAVAGFGGKRYAFVVGASVAAVLWLAWFAAILKLEAMHLQCFCERCTKVFTFGETLSSRPVKGTRD